MFKFCVCVFILATAVTAYDFTDSDFNEYLFEELRADNDDNFDALDRSRRDADVSASSDRKECSRREGKKDFNCCKGDKIDVEQLEAYKVVKKVCHMEIAGNNSELSFDPFDCQKMQLIKEQMVCEVECVAKKFNLVTENGELHPEATLEIMRKRIGDSQWKKEAVKSIVDRCLTEVKRKRAESAATKGCNSGPLEFHHCIWKEFSGACPVQMRIETPKCNRIRESLGKDDTSILNKHFLHHFSHMRHEETN